MLADKFPQVALPRDEGDDRDRPVRPLRLDQLRELRALVGHEVHIGRARREPEDQLVEKQHHGVVAEPLGVVAHDGEAGVEVHEGLAARRRHIGVGGEDLANQIANQPLPFHTLGWFEHGGLEGFRVPGAFQLAPSVVARAALVQRGKEGVVALAGAHLPRVLEQRLAEVEAGHRRIGMDAADMLGIAAEHRALHVARADHVEGHHQEAAPMYPAIVPIHDRGELGDRAGALVAGEQQVQHRHEVALARAEGAMEVAGGAFLPLDRTLDEAQRVVEGAAKLVGDDVVADRLLGMCLRDALGELQDEIALVDPLRDLDQVAQQGARVGGVAHADALRPRPRRGTATGCQAATAASVMPSDRASSFTNTAK